jgi:hypothetical protein
MRYNRGLLPIMVLLGASIASVGALTHSGARPVAISPSQFHDNCLAQQGQFEISGGQVTCKVGSDVAITCQGGGALDNCLWTGPIAATTLAGIFRDPAVAKPAEATGQIGTPSEPFELAS